MKKFLSLMMAVILIFALAACTGDENVRGEYEGNNPAATSGTNTFDTGKVSANKYLNKFAGISCELGSDWKYKTDEEIRQNNETAMGMIGEEYSQAIQKASTFTDMMATHTNGTDTVNVTFEKLTGANLVLTESGYAEASKDSLKGALESMGMTNVTVSVGEESFAGAKHPYIAISAQFNGIAVYERLAILKCSNYIVVVTVCTWQNDTCSEILSNFKAI